MSDLLERFLEIAENNENLLTVENLLSEEERIEWETLVKALDSIDILNVGKDLKKITKIYRLNKWQQMAILAYVKILELMMKRAKDAGALESLGQIGKGLKPQPASSQNHEFDAGSMFG